MPGKRETDDILRQELNLSPMRGKPCGLSEIAELMDQGDPKEAIRQGWTGMGRSKGEDLEIYKARKSLIAECAYRLHHELEQEIGEKGFNQETGRIRAKADRLCKIATILGEPGSLAQARYSTTYHGGLYCFMARYGMDGDEEQRGAFKEAYGKAAEASETIYRALQNGAKDEADFTGRSLGDMVKEMHDLAGLSEREEDMEKWRERQEELSPEEQSIGI